MGIGVLWAMMGRLIPCEIRQRKCMSGCANVREGEGSRRERTASSALTKIGDARRQYPRASASNSCSPTMLSKGGKEGCKRASRAIYSRACVEEG
jgi:hypothetical protein